MVRVDGRVVAMTFWRHGQRGDGAHPCGKSVQRVSRAVSTDQSGISQLLLAGAVYVNREEDMGLEGLRHAKMSYYPVDFARKYSVKKKY